MTDYPCFYRPPKSILSSPRPSFGAILNTKTCSMHSNSLHSFSIRTQLNNLEDRFNAGAFAVERSAEDNLASMRAHFSPKLGFTEEHFTALMQGFRSIRMQECYQTEYELFFSKCTKSGINWTPFSRGTTNFKKKPLDETYNRNA